LYYSSAWQVLEERTGGVSTATIQYVWSPVYVDALILRDRSTQNNGTLDERLWVQQDANWNVTALVNTSGTVVERDVYDPYGKVTFLNASWGTLSGSAYSWIYLDTGGRFDPISSLYNFRHREVSPSLARWMETDPMGLRASDSDLYRFDGDNALNTTDPLGLWWPSPYMNSSISALGRLTLIFDPRLSRKVNCCYKIVMVQVVQVRATSSMKGPDDDGVPILPGNLQADWTWANEITTKPDYWQVDVPENWTEPYFQNPAEDPMDDTVGPGKERFGQTGFKFLWFWREAILKDRPMTSGGDKGFQPRLGGLQVVSYYFQTFAFCASGPDCGKWYEGVDWKYRRTAKDKLKGSGGLTTVTNWNVDSPSGSFLAAFNLFNKVRGFTPCSKKTP
jgi:RHS repeat-associated protein